MKNLFLLFMIFSLSAIAQPGDVDNNGVPGIIPTFKNMKITKLPNSETKSDSIVVIGGDGILKKSLRSSFFSDMANMYVPFSGGQRDVDLSGRALFSAYLVATSGLKVQNDTYPETFFNVDINNRIATVGDYNYNANGTAFAVRDFDKTITFNCDNPNNVTINGNSILTTASPPTGVPYSGAYADVDLGDMNITARNYFGSKLKLSNSTYPISFFDVNSTQKYINIGDWNNENNNTSLVLDDDLKSININVNGIFKVNNSNYPNGFFEINNTARLFRLGDSNNSYNSTSIELSDFSKSFYVNALNFYWNSYKVLTQLDMISLLDGVGTSGDTMNKLQTQINTNLSFLTTNFNRKGVVNNTTTALTTAMLNSQYPSSSNVTKVFCLSIVAGKMIYEKINSTWVGYPCIIP